MKELSKLVDQLQDELPDVRVQLEEPTESAGSYFAEFYRGPFKVFTEWRRGLGVGLSAGQDFVFGEGPHEIHPTGESAASRIRELLSTKRPTRAPDEVALHKLRVVRRLSQQEMAKRLRITQASVSKIERQSDMYLSTLGRVVVAMGGRLELRAKFPDSEFRITDLGDLKPVVTGGSVQSPKRTRRRIHRSARHK